MTAPSPRGHGGINQVDQRIFGYPTVDFVLPEEHPGESLPDPGDQPNDIQQRNNDSLHPNPTAAKVPWAAVRSASHTDYSTATARGLRDRPWRTSIFRIGPIAGICAMLVAIGSILASLAILVGSNGAPLTSWAAPPSTYLAICTAVANLAIRYACIQGVAIAWWCRALRGTTLAKLHHDWRAGTTVVGALASGRRMGLLGVACICSVLVLGSAPLLQRATTVVSAPITGSVLLNVTISPEIPHGYTGWWNRGHWQWSGLFNDTIPTATGNQSNKLYALTDAAYEAAVAPKWLSNAGLHDFVQGCDGVCKAKVRAPALAAVACSQHALNTDYNVPVSQKMYHDETMAFDLGHNLFLITTEIMIEEHESINLLTGWAQSENCVGTFNWGACTLESAIGEYDITIDHNVATLDTAVPRIISTANNTAINHTIDKGDHKSTLAGVAAESFVKWESFYAMYRNADQSDLSTESYGYAYFPFINPSAHGDCPSFIDPYAEVLKNLNTLMFISGVVAGREDANFLERNLDPGLEVDTTTTGYLQGEQSVYQIDFRFFLAAALVDVVCIALILPTYWGWWRFGRSASFSPLEIAKAFNAPLLSR